MKSNVRQLSNVYILKKSFFDDKEFQEQVRGRENLRKMLIYLTGKAWVKGYVSVQNEIHRLTPLQQSQFEMESYCSRGKRTEKVWGLVKTEQGLRIECRCENTACKYFDDCRSDYVPKKTLKGTVFLKDKYETEMKLPDLPDPVLLLSDDDMKLLYTQGMVMPQQ